MSWEEGTINGSHLSSGGLNPKEEEEEAHLEGCGWGWRRRRVRGEWGAPMGQTRKEVAGVEARLEEEEEERKKDRGRSGVERS